LNHGSLKSSGSSLVMDAVRIDKWLWAARFFKTRSLASRACDLGRIELNGSKAKPAREVRTGDQLVIRNDGGRFDVNVLAVTQVRGPAAVAQTLYHEADASREARMTLVAERNSIEQFLPRFPGRPTKRDRRRIIQFRERA
jgi:ribosome-associated heat shock protein Hsp15